MEAKSESDKEREAAAKELTRLFRGLSDDTLIVLWTMARAMKSRRAALTPGSVRRTAWRMRAIERFAELKRENPKLSAHRAIRRVVWEFRHSHPELQIAVRTMQTWVENWNRVGPNGLTGGWPVLVDCRGWRGGRREKGL